MSKKNRKKIPMVMVDNYDSFTFNLVQYFQELGCDVSTYRNDELTATEVLAKKPQFVVISPGPSNPDRAGICLDLIKQCAEKKMPLLGVCLGHQAIGQAFGGKVIRAKTPMHGKVSDILHKKKGVFAGLPSPVQATRYHSLIVERKSLPKVLSITAETSDGLIMGLKHKTLPIEGVQFHPESVLTENGKALLNNFIAFASKIKVRR